MESRQPRSPTLARHALGCRRWLLTFRLGFDPFLEFQKAFMGPFSLLDDLGRVAGGKSRLDFEMSRRFPGRGRGHG